MKFLYSRAISRRAIEVCSNSIILCFDYRPKATGHSVAPVLRRRGDYDNSVDAPNSPVAHISNAVNRLTIAFMKRTLSHVPARSISFETPGTENESQPETV